MIFLLTIIGNAVLNSNIQGTDKLWDTVTHDQTKKKPKFLQSMEKENIKKSRLLPLRYR